MDLLAIIPSRNRPDTVSEIAAAFWATCTAATRIVFAVDSDDPKLGAYVTATFEAPGTSLWINRGKKTMVEALNGCVADFLDVWDPPLKAFAFMGDDHRPRTNGWDTAYVDALVEMGTGIVYGNDLLQGESIPTQVAMTPNIPRVLGYMAPPSLRHLYVDNYWKQLGQGADCLRYLPDVIVEHMHPYAGKAAWDEGHMRVNARPMYDHDRAVFEVLAIEADVAKVKAL